MAARPPQDDDDAEPEAIEFGIAALDGRLDRGGVEFPATASELVRGLDDPEIPVDAAGHTVRLSEALEAVPVDRFESRSELMELLHPVFEERRSSTSLGLVARLRDVLPF
jgi:hypothetical protein